MTTTIVLKLKQFIMFKYKLSLQYSRQYSKFKYSINYVKKNFLYNKFMKSSPQQQKDFFLIAKQIKNQQNINNQMLENDLEDRFKKQSQQALKMINAYRKVENVKTSNTNYQKQPIKNINQDQAAQSNRNAKSSYANKIKQTLRQLNANRAKQYEKLSSKQLQLKSQKNINSLQLNNQRQFRKQQKSQNQRKLITKGTQKFAYIFNQLLKKQQKRIFNRIKQYDQMLLQNDYKMARKYRLFRLFFLWKQETVLLKIQNQKKAKQEKNKQIQGLQMAKQFYIFKTTKKVIKYWSKITTAEKKKRKYNEQLRKVQIQQHINKPTSHNVESMEKTSTNCNSELQNKLRGFLDGLKQKIQSKQIVGKPLKPIIQKIQQQKNESQFLGNKENDNEKNQHQNQNALINQSHQDLNNQLLNNQGIVVQNQNQHLAPQKPMTNQQLQKRRKQICQRSKNRKQALQKIKKQKQITKKKQDQERKQLQRKIQEEQKRIKQIKYKQYQERRKLEKQWEEREKELIKRAEQWNRLRLVKFYGFDNWKKLKLSTRQNTIKLVRTTQKIMVRHLGNQLFQNLNYNMQCVLDKLYNKMTRLHQRNLKRKVIKGFKLQLKQAQQQKLHLAAFHQVHTQKIFLSLWKQILDQLKLQNMEEQRPLVKRANEFCKINLLLKSLKQLKQNSKQSKKQKNINEQKLKIKSKIKNIISEKINIDYDQFL